MTIRDDIQAVRDNPTLTRAEKRQQIYDIKGNAIVAEFVPLVGQTITRGRFTLTLLAAPTYEINYNRPPPTKLLVFYVAVTRDGIRLPVNLPVVLVNCAIMVPDGLGGFVLDVRAAVRDTLIDALKPNDGL